MQKLLASTAASQARLGSLPKAMPTLAPEGPVRAPGQIRACARQCRSPQLRCSNVLRAGAFPAQRAERSVFKCLTRVPPPVEWGVTCEQQFNTNCSTGSDSEAVAGIPLPAKAGSSLPSTLMDPPNLDGLSHRFRSHRVTIDLLAPDGLGQRADLGTIPPAHTDWT